MLTFNGNYRIDLCIRTEKVVIQLSGCAGGPGPEVINPFSC